jgi:hypothetical protein
MHATQQCPANQAPRRSIGVVATHGEWFLLEIHDGRKTDFYMAKKIPSDFGQAYVLEKQDEHGTVETYHLCLDGRQSTCDCPGHCFTGHCKHWEGMQVLAAYGKLPGYRSPSLREVTGPFKPGRDDEPEDIFVHPTACGCRSCEEHEAICLQPYLEVA